MGEILTKVNHSPGPWSTHLVDDTLVLDASGTEIADMIGNYDACAATMEANARLIAAAPELLAAIKKLRVKFARCLEFTGSADFAIKAACEEADAAIAKATGESV